MTRVYELPKCLHMSRQSRGYTGFMSVRPPLLYVLMCLRCYNSKLLSRISFKHVFGSGEEHYFKVTLNSNNNKVMVALRLEI